MNYSELKKFTFVVFTVYIVFLDTQVFPVTQMKSTAVRSSKEPDRWTKSSTSPQRKLPICQNRQFFFFLAQVRLRLLRMGFRRLALHGGGGLVVERHSPCRIETPKNLELPSGLSSHSHACVQLLAMYSRWCVWVCVCVCTCFFLIVSNTRTHALHAYTYTNRVSRTKAKAAANIECLPKTKTQTDITITAVVPHRLNYTLTKHWWKQPSLFDLKNTVSGC
jgi:hypothetical protein